MKTILISLLFICSCSAAHSQLDSLSRIAVHVINDERKRIGIDTLIYESDTFCFATDWADSTHRYFNIEKKWFSRDAAHRNCEERMNAYETIRNREWKYFGECVAFGKIHDKENPAEHYAKGLLNSKDHYKMLMMKGFKRIFIGIHIKDGFFNMVVFVTTEFE